MVLGLKNSAGRAYIGFLHPDTIMLSVISQRDGLSLRGREERSWLRSHLP